MVFRNLWAFIEHDDANRVTADDFAAYKTELLKTKGRTTQKYIAYTRAIFKLGKLNRIIDDNPTSEITYTAPKQDARLARQDFDMAEVARIVELCRQSDDPVIRIGFLIAAYTGASREEWVEAHTRILSSKMVRSSFIFGLIIVPTRCGSRPISDPGGSRSLWQSPMTFASIFALSPMA